jgi:membrane protein YqaA with SNARE-associated domain
MKIFSILYEKAMHWARHPKAPWFLGGLSFAESSFFPVPPDVMLAPMSLAKPNKAWYYATLTTVTSVLGGILGYFIGVFAFDLIEPILHNYGYYDRYELAKNWFETWGFWAIFVAGFSPIPYKVFTIASGVVGMAFLPFVLASLVGRGLRFFMVAGLMAWGGEPMEKKLHKYMDIIGWLTVGLIVILWLIYR